MTLAEIECKAAALEGRAVIRQHVLLRLLLVIGGILTVWWAVLPEEPLKAFASSTLAGALATLIEGLVIRGSTGT